MIDRQSVKNASVAVLLCGCLGACGGGDDSSLVIIAGSNTDGGKVVVIGRTGDDIAPGEGGAEGSQTPDSTALENKAFTELMANTVQADAFGKVVDSTVSGLRYRSGAHCGTTDSEGNYGYMEGEPVEFFIGDIRLGDAIAPAARLGPYDLASGNPQTAMNIARFLQTLDNDGDPDNGIHINDAVHTLAEGRELDFASAGWLEEPSPTDQDLVDGQWFEKKSEVESLVLELSSATEAGARDLLPAGAATYRP